MTLTKLLSRAIISKFIGVNEGVKAFEDMQHDIISLGKSTMPVNFADLGNANIGDRAFISDATSLVFGVAASGGGAINAPVYFDGIWRIG